MITHDSSVNPPATALSSLQAEHLREKQRALLRQLRSEKIAIHRPNLQKGAGPIRVMARIVAELEQACRQHHIAESIIQSEIVNRTIGDVNLRLVTECEGEPGSAEDYRLLADELGIALPGEEISGYQATGQTYRWLREQMMECERLLLAQHYDPRIYDIYGVGNLVLRTWLTHTMEEWGIPITPDRLFLSLGAMDGIDKALRGLALHFREQGLSGSAVLFPEPGFNVPEWQARTLGYRLHCFPTLREHRFKLMATQLDEILEQAPDIRVIYLTVTNNPTTFAYTPDELQQLHSVLRRHRERGRTLFVLADLAYIGTGKPEEDLARMATFSAPDILKQAVFVSSFSKTHTLTGERFGWVTCGDPGIANTISASWTNTNASLPGEWQLRYMAYYRLFQERPWLNERLRMFYRLRRQRLIAQLQWLDKEHRLFEHVFVDDDATVYNWSQLRPGVDAFSLFEKTGIAGVPGSGFGYSDDYIRFSIGVIPVPAV